MPIELTMDTVLYYFKVNLTAVLFPAIVNQSVKSRSVCSG